MVRELQKKKKEKKENPTTPIAAGATKREKREGKVTKEGEVTRGAPSFPLQTLQRVLFSLSSRSELHKRGDSRRKGGELAGEVDSEEETKETKRLYETQDTGDNMQVL